MRLSQKGLMLVFVLLAASPSWALTDKVVVLNTATELTDYFAASAKEHPESLEVFLAPTAKWVVFGKFRAYTLKKLPLEVTADRVAKEHWKNGPDRIIETTHMKRSQFAVKKENIPYSYIVVHFWGGLLQDTQLVDVCIPLTAFRQLLDKGQKPKVELVK